MISKEGIKNLLATNDKAVLRAVLAIDARQTADERSSENTKYLNGMGWRPCHARMGSSMASFAARRGYLTTNQINWWRKRMKCGNSRIEIYAGQLLEVAKAKVNAT